ncbi:hypothetical protein AB8810_10980 [Xanthomonas sp. NCPPB 3005]|uniref:hypothetical protein n=1 Tax=Xanthomonas sp. NCPPB 3005 TaxID=3240913 RepID=UPI003516EF02
MEANPATKLHKDAELINRLGGPAKIARRLSFEMPQGTRRVQNWKYRGIPPFLRVTRVDVFGPFSPAGSEPQGEDPDADRIIPIEAP